MLQLIKNIKAITKSTDVPETVITTNNHNLFDDDVIYIFRASDDTTGFGDL